MKYLDRCNMYSLHSHFKKSLKKENPNNLDLRVIKVKYERGVELVEKEIGRLGRRISKGIYGFYKRDNAKEDVKDIGMFLNSLKKVKKYFVENKEIEGR